MFQGFSPDLQTARDLLGKLGRDNGRIRRDPAGADAAFDFFVTAEHMPEWFYRGDTKRANRLRNKYMLLRVVSHLASGAKHFHATAPQHHSVRDVRHQPGAFQRGTFQADAFDVGYLAVELNGPEAHKYGKQVDVRVLAAHVLTFWARRVTARSYRGPMPA